MNATNIIQIIDLFSGASGRAPTTLCRLAGGSGNIYRRLRAGADITARRADRIVQWVSDHWPIDALWPQDIPRPPPSPDSPAALADAERLENLIKGPVKSETAALNGRGRLADPKALVQSLLVSAELAVTDEYVAAYLDTYYQVCRQYADDGPRGDQIPRRGSRARQVLDALVEAGDVRFRRRVAAYRVVPRAAGLLREAR